MILSIGIRILVEKNILTHFCWQRHCLVFTMTNHSQNVSKQKCQVARNITSWRIYLTNFYCLHRNGFKRGFYLFKRQTECLPDLIFLQWKSWWKIDPFPPGPNNLYNSYCEESMPDKQYCTIYNYEQFLSVGVGRRLKMIRIPQIFLQTSINVWQNFSTTKQSHINVQLKLWLEIGKIIIIIHPANHRLGNILKRCGKGFPWISKSHKSKTFDEKYPVETEPFLLLLLLKNCLTKFPTKFQICHGYLQPFEDSLVAERQSIVKSHTMTLIKNSHSPSFKAKFKMPQRRTVGNEAIGNVFW